MKVIDSSSIAKYVNKEENWAEVEEQLLLDECVTLEFAVEEVGNSVWKRVLKKELSEQNALIIYKEFVKAVYENGLITLTRADPDLLNNSMELAIQEKVTIYDGTLIELAKSNACELITSDEKQHDVSKRRYSKMPVIHIR